MYPIAVISTSWSWGLACHLKTALTFALDTPRGGEGGESKDRGRCGGSVCFSPAPEAEGGEGASQRGGTVQLWV